MVSDFSSIAVSLFSSGLELLWDTQPDYAVHLAVMGLLVMSPGCGRVAAWYAAAGA